MWVCVQDREGGGQGFIGTRLILEVDVEFQLLPLPHQVSLLVNQMSERTLTIAVIDCHGNLRRKQMDQSNCGHKIHRPPNSHIRIKTLRIIHSARDYAIDRDREIETRRGKIL